MKKIIRIFFITLGVILILLITLPILFKGKIETIVKEQVNKSILATVDWDKFSLSLFRGFPDLSINLHGVSVVGMNEFDGDTLAGFERFEFRANLFSAIGGEIDVKSILLDRPLINGIVLEDGKANYDIVPPSEPKTEEAEESPTPKESDEDGGANASSMKVSLKRFAIQHGRIKYSDEVMGVAAEMEDFNFEMKGDLSLDQTELELMVAIDGIQAKYEGVRYMRNGKFGLDIVAAADMVNSIYTLKKNEIRINGLVLGAEGTVAMPADGAIIPDIRFFTKETSFQTLLSLVPAIYLTDFESLKTSGSLILEGSVAGVMKDSLMPDATINLRVTDGFFSYPDLPKDVSDVQIALSVNYNGTDMDATTVNLDRFHLLLGGNPFDISFRADHPFSDLHIAGMVKGVIDFATLQDIVPMEELNLSGRLDADLNWDTKLSFIENEQFEEVDLDGKLIIEGMLIEAPDIPVPVQLKRMALFFTPQYVNLETVDLLLGSSDLHLDGRLINFIPYLFDNKTVSGSLNVSSSLLDANEFLTDPEVDTSAITEDNADKAIQEEEVVEILADSLAQPAQMKIPENVDFKLAIDMKKLVYDNIVVENLTGKMAVSDGIANLDKLIMNILKGSVGVSGTVDTRPEFTDANVVLDMKDIDIPTSYETFVAIERLAPIAKSCKGTANVTMDLFTKLDASFNPLYESIDANGHLYGRDLKIEQTASLEKLSSMLKSEKLRNLELDKVDFRFAIRNGRVIVEPFDMNFDRSKITASGSHGIDQTMDYLMDMNIAKSDLGSGANEVMSSIGALASGAGFAVPQSDYIKVKANITGTFKDPKVSTDLSGNFTDTKAAVKTAVKERVTEEVQKVEEQVRDEAGAKAEELIKNAEAEKAKLISQAEAAGEKLKKEAEVQGDKLIKEAGNNPLKQVAAKKAASELAKQADKQADKLIEEAELKGDALIQKAKEEAGRI